MEKSPVHQPTIHQPAQFIDRQFIDRQFIDRPSSSFEKQHKNRPKYATAT
jgi:hypothetical protein